MRDENTELMADLEYKHSLSYIIDGTSKSHNIYIKGVESDSLVPEYAENQWVKGI